MTAMLLPAPAAARQQAAARIEPGGAQPVPQYQQVLSGHRSQPQSSACAVPAGGDYDIDNDRLIEVCSLAQLNAIRWDGDGDGAATAAGHAAAFGGAATGMGCPAAGCNGYELTADLDFDTDGDGNAGAGDTYWNAGKGWTPVDRFSGRHGRHVVFEGNGHTISNLFVDTTSSNAGLFACVCSSVVRNLGLESVDVTGTKNVGGLAGTTSQGGAITGSYTTGEVSGGSSVGGLVGQQTSGSIVDGYSTAQVSADGTGGNEFIGGLVGRLLLGSVKGSYAGGDVSGGTAVKVGGLVGVNYGSIVASYASGDVSGTGILVGGLVGFNQGPITASYAVGNLSGAQAAGGLAAYPVENFEHYVRITPTTASYWDTQTTGVSWRSGDGDGKTTAELQGPTGYTGLYASWNVDLDGDGSADDPWDFGTSAQYPALKRLGISVADQRSQMPGAAGSQPAASSEQQPAKADGTYSVTATASVVEGETATVTITLSEAAPEDGVKFALKRGWHRDGRDASNADVGRLARSATVPQGSRTAEVDIVTIDDGYVEDDKIFAVIVTADTSGWATEGSGKDTAQITIRDNDTAGVTVSHGTLDVPEGGTATYTVVLDAAPVGDVTIAPSSGDVGAVSVSPASAVFGSHNWNVPQSFTVSGEADADADDESVTISHRVTVGRGTVYLGVTAPSLTVTVTDSTPPPILNVQEPEPEPPEPASEQQQATEQPLDTVAVPGPVQGLVLSLTADGAIDVTWQAPQSGDAPENYIVHLRNQDSGKGKNRKVKAPKTTTTWRNLQAGATYRVWVRAQNAGGKGERVRAVITVPAPPAQ
ncbi:fibronectin type III domain-containing protein [Candidatus Poriferisodalis sp.]|uniref:fibronectin type III domain-containing protein n=1 Tax=Candidatus Poriferisodalis sp. TaxID=3101277 RepID=UPI003B0122BB